MPRHDAAHKWTDEQLEKLEKRMAREYSQAAKEMRGKLDRSLKDYARERSERLKAMDDTPEAREAFKAWCQEQTLQQGRMAAMVEELSQNAARANQKAAEAANDLLPVIYAENANRAAYEVDKALRHDTSFALVDEQTVRELMQADMPVIRETVMFIPDKGFELLQDVRKVVPDHVRDMRWNRQKFTSAITQGILQGESIPNIAKRLDSVIGMNGAAAIRAARTACTSAECAGRISSYERADRLGIDMVQEWVATLDGRTRDEHREADGQQVSVGEPFDVGGEELRWPGDPAGSAENTYNCRCTVRGRVQGLDGAEGDWESAAGERWSRLPSGMTYERWRAGKDG